MSIDQAELFHVEPTEAAVAEPVEKLSPDRRRTLRQRNLVAAGVHPLTGRKARPDLSNLAGVDYRVLYSHHDRTYPKCNVGPQSSGAATDVRRWWPACERWEAAP